jgi:hypothetical protein
MRSKVISTVVQKEFLYCTSALHTLSYPHLHYKAPPTVE